MGYRAAIKTGIEIIKSFVIPIHFGNFKFDRGFHTYSFGHPFAGFFLARDILTASRQSPLILTTSGFGPGFSF
jgi:hypothetical protein